MSSATMALRIGPYDRRLLKKRCTTCIQAHAKCNGQILCNLCRRTGRRCIYSTNIRGQITLEAPTATSKANIVTTSGVPAFPASPWAEHCIGQFFNAFLLQHDFVGYSSLQEDIQRSLGSCECLQQTVLAIGCLSLESLHVPGLKTKRRALEYYQNALSLIRTELESHDVKEKTNDQLLWSTLLLALFELLYDPTGAGFLCHFGRGTAALMRMNDPLTYTHGKRFGSFQLARLLEMLRAVAFWDSSFCAQPEWEAAIDLTIRDGIDGSSDTGSAGLFNRISRLVEQATRLGCNIFQIVKHTPPENLSLNQTSQLTRLADEGARLQRALQSWHTHLSTPSTYARNSMKTQSVSVSHVDAGYTGCDRNDIPSTVKFPWPIRRRLDSQLLLSQIFYHAVSVNLCNDFYASEHFTQLASKIPTPLSNEAVQKHVQCMLSLIESALKHTNIAGIILLWPILAAGARAVNKAQVDRAKALFSEVKRRGFAVAKAYEAACMDLWWNPKGLIQIDGVNSS